MDLPGKFSWLGTVLPSQTPGTAIQQPDGSVKEHSLPTTLGPLAGDSPRHVPGPWMGDRRCLRGRGPVLPQPPKEPLNPSPPLRRVHWGGRRGALFGASCTSAKALVLVSEPPEMSLASSRGNPGRPSQDPAALWSTISGPYPLDLGTMIRKLSHMRTRSFSATLPLRSTVGCTLPLRSTVGCNSFHIQSYI